MGFLDLFRRSPVPTTKEFSSRLDEIESQMRLLRMEWQETYDKVHHALDRVVKRWNRSQEAPGNVNQQTDGDQKPVQMDLGELWKIARSRGMVR